MRGTKAKRLRTEREPNPGRKYGGFTKDQIEHVKAGPPQDRQRKPTKPEGERR